MSVINPASVVLAREVRGWTQAELADAIGVTQSFVSKGELRLAQFSDSHIEEIAHRLRFDPDFFRQPDHVVALGGDFLYRRKSRVTVKTRRRVEAEANVRKLQVQRLLKAAAIEAPFVFPMIDLGEQGVTAEHAAQMVREAWRIPPGPVPNVTRSIEAAGGIVFLVDFETDMIDGTNIRLAGMPPLLFVDKNKPGERHRFSLAHELAHAIMHFSTTQGDAEDEANAFAREFLLPKKLVRADLRSLNLAAAARLKPLWGVSMHLLIYRAAELGCISPTAAKRMYMTLRAGGARVEPLPIEREKAEAFDRLIAWHKETLGFSADDLRALLFTESLGSLPVVTRPTMRLVGGLFGDDKSDAGSTPSSQH